MDSFEGAINDYMMVGYTYFNIDITPKVYLKGKRSFEKLIS